MNRSEVSNSNPPVNPEHSRQKTIGKMSNNFEDSIVRKVGRFDAIYEAEDGEFYSLAETVTVLVTSHGEHILEDETRDESIRAFRIYLVEIGVIQDDEDIGRPLVHSNTCTVEYFKQPISSKNN